MLSYFWTTPVKTRIEKCEELNKPLLQIAELRAKEAELSAAAKLNGPGSVDFSKHRSVAKLLTDIDGVIARFNESKAEVKANDPIDMAILVERIASIVDNTLKTEIAILKKPRNAKRENLSSVVYGTTYGATVVATAALTLPTIGKLVILSWAPSHVSNKIGEMTGLNNLTPRTVVILEELLQTLELMKLNLSSYLPPKAYALHDKLSDYYTCPILQDELINPVFCTLDFRTYEKSAIEQWLTASRTSPVSRKMMEPDQTPQDVLFPNLDYKALIEKIRELDIKKLNEPEPDAIESKVIVLS